MIKIETTKLWKKLKNGNKDISQTLQTNLNSLLPIIVNRSKLIRDIFPEYTLHDENHLAKIIYIMGKLIKKTVMDHLNPIEIYLLILSTFFHDQGMVVDAKEKDEIMNSEEYINSLDLWKKKHPNNNFSSIEKIIEKKKNIKIKKELESKINNVLYFEHFQDYIRKRHGERVKNFLWDESNWNNFNWEINSVDIRPILELICSSHTQDYNDITKNIDDLYDRQLGEYKINIIFLIIFLRLGDILDFDRDRTPQIIWKSISISNKISITEWRKHLSVEGWSIDNEEIQYNCPCERPEYQKAILELMDWIDVELINANKIFRNFPDRVKKYKIKLPLRVDRERIKPKDEMYIYHDEEFELQREKIIELFLTDKLYKDPSLCIRELIQNSFDALEMRKIFFQKETNMNWDQGEINLKHYIDEQNREILECSDNGIGMDIDDIIYYLIKIGRSYYQSHEFFKLKHQFKEIELEFYPISQFGIGFLSCFMLGDRVSINTRKTLGCNNPQKSLIVEFNGISSMPIIKESPLDLPVGTTVRIFLREKQTFYHTFFEKIKLCKVVDRYIRKTNFTINAQCLIPEIQKELKLPPGIHFHETALKEIKLTQVRSLEYDYNKIHPKLEGKIFNTFLVDENDNFVLENDEAKWVFNEDLKDIVLITNNTKYSLSELTRKMDERNILCFDGILVAGSPGDYLQGGCQYFYDCLGCCILNVKDELKSPLTPSRFIMNGHFWGTLNAKDRFLQNCHKLAQGCLWEEILIQLFEKPVIFWKLVFIYNFDVLTIKKKKLMKYIHIPMLDDSKKLSWVKLEDINMESLEIVKTERRNLYMRFYNKDFKYDFPEDMQNFMHHGDSMENMIFKIIKHFSIVKLANNKIDFYISSDIEEDDNALDSHLFIGQSVFSLQYFTDNLNDILCCEYPKKVNSSSSMVNRNHPLIQHLIQIKDKDNFNDLDLFLIELGSLLTSTDLIENLKKNKQFYAWFKMTACSYKKFKPQIDLHLLPPYQILTREGTFMSITEDDFIKWAKLPNDELIL